MNQQKQSNTFIIGIQISRRNLNYIQYIVSVFESLKKLKSKTDLGILSSSLRSDIFDFVLNQNKKLEHNLHNVQMEFQRQSKIKKISSICQICNHKVDDKNNQKFNFAKIVLTFQ